MDGVSGFAQTLGDDDGKTTAPGDETYGRGGWRGIRENGDRAGHRMSGNKLVYANYTLS